MLNHRRGLARYVLVPSGAILVTCTLLLLMQYLIRSDDDGINEPPKGSILDIVRVIEEKEPESRPKPPAPPPKPEELPPPPVLTRNAGGSPTSVGPFRPMPPDVDVLRASDNDDVIPVMMVAPEYPPRALAQHVEGYVVLEFTVTPAGTVENPRVLQAVPKGYFEHAAKNAALRFKYRPRVVDGRAVSAMGVRNVIRFEITDPS
jgi:protein TonB